ncbi:MAG: hypothetical protein JSR24_00740 [Proteobacteria bacterium]|nr:hypothetical protein [Pseudomonadota bacterium]
MQTSARDLSSQIVLLERDGHYFFYQPAFGLIASGDDVASAYQKFGEAQRLYLNDVQRAGLELPTAQGIRQAAGVAVHRSAAAEIWLFAAKFGLAVVLLGVAGSVAVSALSGALASAAQGVSKAFAGLSSITLSDVVTKSDDIVRDIKTLPESRKEDLRRNVGEISRQLTPIVEAWRNPPASADPR